MGRVVGGLCITVSMVCSWHSADGWTMTQWQGNVSYKMRIVGDVELCFQWTHSWHNGTCDRYVNTTPVLPGSIIAGAALAEIMHRVKCLNAEKQKSSFDESRLNGRILLHALTGC